MHDVEDRRMYAKVTERLFGEPSAPVRIGRYRVEGRLGSGAMGVVYAAVDERLGRKLAIKLLHESFAGDPTGRARLLREAQAMARLRHENVVLIYDVGTHSPPHGVGDEQVFIAMELVEGRTLDRWLREAPAGSRWAPDDILSRFLQAGRALSAAHRAGVLHRDFKPENVLVDPTGRVRVLDFGLARALADADAEPDPDDSLSAPLTRTGSILGTPAYMAPEQLRGAPTDARADQFSFCVALYEALYNDRPFTAVARFAPVAVTHVPKDSRVPTAVRRALLRGLSELPGDRWPDMDALLAALRPPPRPRRGLGLAGVLLIVGAGLGAWAAASLRPAPIVAELPAPTPAPAPIVAPVPGPAALLDPRLGEREQQLRDSLRAARFHPLLARDPTAAALLLRELPAASEGLAGMRRQVLAQPLTRFRVYTRELQALWFDAAGDLWLVDAVGTRRHDSSGRPRAPGGAGEPPAPPEPPSPPARPDPSAGLWPAPDGGKPLRLTLGRLTLGRQRLPEHDGELTALAWSPDGQHIAVAGAQVLVWDRRGVLRARDAGHEGTVRSLRWSPAGDRLLIGGDDGQARIIHIGRDPSREPRVLRGHDAAITELAWHPAGDLVATAASDGSVRVWSLVPGAAVRIDHPGAVQDLRWQPGGARLATAGDDGKVRLLARDGGEPQILHHGRRVLAVAWSPDGKQLASAGAGSSVRVWAADGSPLRELPTGGRGDVLAVTWTPAGDLLAASIDDRLVVWSAGQGPARPVQAPRVTLLSLAIRPATADIIDLDAPLELASDSSPARRWTLDLSEATPTLRELARLGEVNDLAWCDDGVLALAREDRRVDLLTAETPVDLRRTGAAVTSVACGPGESAGLGAGLVAGLIDGRIRGWSRHPGGAAELTETPEFTGHLTAVDALAISPDGETLASADAAGHLYLWPWSDAAIAQQLRAATHLCLGADERVTWLGESAVQAAQTAAACAPDRRDNLPR